MERLSLATLTSQNIVSPLLVATYTATEDKELLVQVYLSGLAGNGTYRACVTKQLLGTSTVYQSPTSGASLASTVTTAFLPSIPVPVKDTDVLKVYIQGIAADTSIAAKVEVWDITPTASASMTVGEIADGVWDELLAGHTVLGSTGVMLTTSGSASNPLESEVPGDYPEGSAGFALGRIGVATISVSSPVAVNGFIGPLIYGDDYYAADGRSVVLTLTGQPSLTGSTTVMEVNGQTVTGSIVSATQVRLELSSVQTMAIGAGMFNYDLKATLLNTHTATVGQGTILIVGDQR